MIRILLAHPSRLVCDSLRAALDKEQDMYVVGCAICPEELHFLLPHGNVVLLGTDLGDTSALDLLDEIRLTQTAARVLILGVDQEPDVILRYIEAGAAGYILQHESVAEMVDKITAVSQQEAIISPRIAAALMDRLAMLANMETPLAFMEARQSAIHMLTPREAEVLQLICDGYSNGDIADQLVIECGTVKNHVHNILKKLDVRNRHEAASLYRHHGRPALATAA